MVGADVFGAGTNISFSPGMFEDDLINGDTPTKFNTSAPEKWWLED